MDYDFSGWATRANVKCSDGRTIMKGAFRHNDGQTVPLVWNHQHNDPFNVLGHALLESRDNGVYAYCTLNDTNQGKNARELIQHGDVEALSIFANHLQQKDGNVYHGDIREVSVVLAGANPGAFIDSVIRHADDGSVFEDETEATIYTGHPIELAHSDDSDQTVGDVFNSFTDEQKTVAYALIGQALEDAGVDDDNDYDDEDEGDDDELAHDDLDADIDVGEVFDSFTDTQKTVVYALIGQALEDAGVDDDDEDFYHSDDDPEETVGDVFDTLTEKQKNVVYAIIGQALEDAGIEYDDDDEDD